MWKKKIGNETELENYINYIKKYLSDNSNDMIVEYLIENPHYIDKEKLSTNNSDVAAEYMVKKKYYFEIFQEINENNNDLIVEYLIENEKYINWKHLSCNNNDKAVDYLLENPDKIDWEYFSANSNDRAIEYLAEQHFKYKRDKIDFNWMTHNNNDKAIKILLKNQDKITAWSNLLKNNNNKLVDNIFSNYKKNKYNNNKDYSILNTSNIINYLYNVNPWYFSYICVNNNDIAVNFILNERYDKIDTESFSENNNNKAVEYLLLNPNKIYWINFFRNNNNKAVEFIINNINNLEYYFIDNDFIEIYEKQINKKKYYKQYDLLTK